jgi:hypothetical protein
MPDGEVVAVEANDVADRRRDRFQEETAVSGFIS